MSRVSQDTEYMGGCAAEHMSLPVPITEGTSAEEPLSGGMSRESSNGEPHSKSNSSPVRPSDSASDRVDEIKRRTLEYQREFSFDGYMTVRKELFAHLRDPAISIRNDSITFNTACIEGLEDVVYIKLHINESLKRLAITPCSKDDKNALRWCIAKPDKRRSRKIIGKPFSQMLYRFMGWDTNKWYKLMGFKITIENGSSAYIFDLTMSEEHQTVKRRRRKKAEEAGAADGTTVPANKSANPAEAPDNHAARSDGENTEENTQKPDVVPRPKPRLSDRIIASFGDSVKDTDRMMKEQNLSGYSSVGDSK